MKTFLLKQHDGHVQVMRILPNEDGSYSNPGVEVARWHPDSQRVIASWREIEESVVPQDRTFRNAWCDVTPEPVVDIDMAKARNIHRDRLREMRAPKLAALDVEYQRADELNDGAQKMAIAARKQALRDVTKHPDIDAAQTPEQLKAAIPNILS